MSVKLKRHNPGATIESIREVVPSAQTGGHEDWIDFVRSHDGAIPDANEFDVAPNNGSRVQRFLGIEQVKEAQRLLSGRTSQELLPIADAEGGNYVCLGLRPHGSGVFFWDHETEQSVQIAPSFSRFMENLRPFDPESVVLKPGQVVSAWIDPALLEAEKKKH